LWCSISGNGEVEGSVSMKWPWFSGAGYGIGCRIETLVAAEID